MFTGLVRETGTVKRLEASGNLYKLEVSCRSVCDAAGAGDSVAVNGICLTVTSKRQGALSFDVMAETVRRTALSGLRSGDAVNLENALKAGGSLDGHFVQGHIDCIGSVKRITKRGDEFVMEIGFPAEYGHLLVEKGSVAIDGVSLTVGEVADAVFSVYLIPKTLTGTVMNSRSAGSAVNIEFDVIGKYVAKLHKESRPGITEGFLKANGF